MLDRLSWSDVADYLPAAFGAMLGIEAHDLMAIGPRRGPKAAVGRKRQRGDAQVLIFAVVDEGLGVGIEDFDVYAGLLQDRSG